MHDRPSVSPVSELFPSFLDKADQQFVLRISLSAAIIQFRSQLRPAINVGTCKFFLHVIIYDESSARKVEFRQHIAICVRLGTTSGTLRLRFRQVRLPFRRETVPAYQCPRRGCSCVNNTQWWCLCDYRHGYVNDKIWCHLLSPQRSAPQCQLN